MTYEEAYGFSPEILDLINRGQQAVDTEDESPEEEASATEEPDNSEFEDLQTKYSDLEQERDLLQSQLDDYRYSDNPDIQQDDLLNYSIPDGASSVLDMVLDDEASDISWLNKKNKTVNVEHANPTLKSYLNTLPEEYKKELVATSGNDSDVHVKGSKHYDNKAIDLRYMPKIHDYIANDLLAKKYGIKVLNPNHGTAKHTHIQVD